MDAETMMVNRLKKELDVVMVCRFGSHLYGTNTPDSDADYKGIYMPKKDEIYLQNVKKSVRFDSNNSNQKNSADDVDCEMYSLHYFLKLCYRGETAALDMLHCNDQNLLASSYTWMFMVQQRHMFYTKNLKAFVGYAQKQAAKYGLKGSRLNTAEELLRYLGRFPDDMKMINVWEGLPVNDHADFKPEVLGEIKTYQFCGKQIQATAKIEYVRQMVKTFIDHYGDRARKAQANEGVDWKAMSHALRAAYEVKSILEKETIEFPLACADLLLAVKRGEVPFGRVLEWLEEMMVEVNELSEISNLPEFVDERPWKAFLLEECNRVCNS